MSQELEKIQIIPLNIVLFPYTVVQLYLDDPRDCRIINQCLKSGKLLGISLVHFGEDFDNDTTELYLVGTKAQILKVETLDDGTMNVKLSGRERYRIRSIDYADEELLGQIEAINDEANKNEINIDALALRAKELFNEFLENSLEEFDSHLEIVYPNNPVAISFIIANFFPVEPIQKQHFLEITDTAIRLQELIQILLDFKMNSKSTHVYPITTTELKEWINRN